MYKLLLIDDEPLILDGLSRLVNWDEYGLEIEAMVSGGQAAIDLLGHSPIDIVITDIIMPDVTGIDVLKYISDNQLPTKALVLSGYNDFQYVKQAIVYGIENYLTKPVDVADLTNSLTSIIGKLDRERAGRGHRDSSQMSIRNNMFNRLVRNEMRMADFHERIHLLGLPSPSPLVLSCLIKPHLAQAGELSAALIQPPAPAKSMTGLTYYLYEGLEEDLGLIVSFDDGEDTELCLSFLESHLSLQAGAWFPGGAAVAIGDVQRGIQNVHKSHAHARQVLRCLHPFDGALRYDRVKERLDDPMRENDLLAMAREKLSPVVQHVLKLVDSDFSSELSIKTISAQLSFNPVYLGHLFRSEVGMPFSQYLNAYRIEQAKHLLDTTPEKAAVIGQRVGYTNTNYFYTVFKKITDVSPSEWRKLQ